MQVEVFELERVMDNPLFEGFVFEESASVLGRKDADDDFFPIRRDDWNWKLEPLMPIWKPRRVKGRVRSFNDFPCISLMIPAFSKRAADDLRDLLEPNGELLPIVSDVGEFYAYNCHTIVEALDHAESSIKMMDSAPPPMPALWIDYFSFVPERLVGLSIFRLRELCNSVFVTTIFADRVRKLGLNGFNFVKVWPFPKGVRYQTVEAERRRARREVVKSPSGVAFPKAESIFIDFPKSAAKLSAHEKKLLARFQDELDAQLFTSSIDDVYFGCLEGRTTSKGRTRLVLSCPNAQSLLDKLWPWIQALPWPMKPLVYLRHVPWDDFSAAEEPVEP